MCRTGGPRCPDNSAKPLSVPRTAAFSSDVEHLAASREELAHISTEGHNVLSAYTTSRFHKKINAALWTGSHSYENTGEVYPDLDVSDAEAIKSRVAARSINKAENFNAFVNTLDGALAEAPTSDKTVYRGMTVAPSEVFSPEELTSMNYSQLQSPEAQDRYRQHVKASYAPGKVVHFPAYTSSSDSPVIADEFCPGQGSDGVFFQMHTYRGLRASALAERNADEQETLLPRDTYWKVADNDFGAFSHQSPSGHTGRSSGDRNIVTLVECDENGVELTEDAARARRPRPVEGLVDFRIED